MYAKRITNPIFVQYPYIKPNILNSQFVANFVVKIAKNAIFGVFFMHLKHLMSCCMVGCSDANSSKIRQKFPKNEQWTKNVTTSHIVAECNAFS